MIKEPIIQFVCFVTSLNPEQFIPEWERHAKKLAIKKNEAVLQTLTNQTKNKFRFISQHNWSGRDTAFSFMENRKSENFPELPVKVIHAGGYITIQAEQKKAPAEGTVKLIAFISHNENDIEEYRSLSMYSSLNIHQAYYESCLYGYILEFFVPEAQVTELIAVLKQHNGIEIGVYEEALLPHE